MCMFVFIDVCMCVCVCMSACVNRYVCRPPPSPIHSPTSKSVPRTNGAAASLASSPFSASKSSLKLVSPAMKAQQTAKSACFQPNSLVVRFFVIITPSSHKQERWNLAYPHPLGTTLFLTPLLT